LQEAKAGVARHCACCVADRAVDITGIEI